MRLLLDTNILVPMVDGTQGNLPAYIAGVITDDRSQLYGSVVSIWEVAIKHRLGKLPLPCALVEWPLLLAALQVSEIPVSTAQVIAEAEPESATRDPFDRLLLAICAVENMQLVTLDRKLLDHPLAWRPS